MKHAQVCKVVLSLEVMKHQFPCRAHSMLGNETADGALKMVD